ncbi:trehalose-6-phosphate phosphatase [Flagelloscypha sp. PMI_526]|nr:trehalose-6-phosphate phosphatase [Flagelloscypha sp. PMI_526]
MDSYSSFCSPVQAEVTSPLDYSLEEVRIRNEDLEDELLRQEIPLTGRVIHVTHYLPISASLHRPGFVPPGGVLTSPPPTPPLPSPSPPPQEISWELEYRYGHDAMYSGIKSICATHEQVIVGWTGDIRHKHHPSIEVDPTTITQEEKDAFRESLEGYAQDEIHGKHGPEWKGLHYEPVWMDNQVAHGHYDRYCKQILWPLFHYLLWQDVAHEYSSADSGYRPYVEANLAYAKAVAAIWRPGDLVWIHDYHLLMVPKALREEIMRNPAPSAAATPNPMMTAKAEDADRGGGTEYFVNHRDSPGADGIVIGLFVHTPFPSSEVFRCLPRRGEILEGMLGANLICFQTYSYCRHFISTCLRVLGYEVSNGGVHSSSSDPPGEVGIVVQGRVVGIVHCAVGIDFSRVTSDLSRPGIQPKLDALRNLYEGKKIIVGRDKLDAITGLSQKLRGFSFLLSRYPEWRNRVVLIQVTSPALTDSSKLETEISELVSSINGDFGSLDFTPVHHYHQTLKKDEFYALLSVADLGLMTPLRDGMNTTSMELVVAQHTTKKSPSILSEFMGVAQELKDSILVNPYNLGDLANAIHRGLTMSEEEKAERHSRMYETVMNHTNHKWGAVLIQYLMSCMLTAHVRSARSTPQLKTDLLVQRYRQVSEDGCRLFMFDYDGTLTPIVRLPHLAVPSSTTLSVLEKLSSDPQNKVWLVSGRDGDFLDQHFGHLPRVGLSAEHGAWEKGILPSDASSDAQRKWQSNLSMIDMSWMAEVEEIFKYYTERTAGSSIEKKKSTLTWHWRAADPEWGEFQCRQCQDLLENNLVHKRPIEVVAGKKNLEVRAAAVNKGEIVRGILYKNPNAEFIFCAGDDKTDEDMFRALNLFVPPPRSNTFLSPSSSTNPTPTSTPSMRSRSLKASPSAASSVRSPSVGTPNMNLTARGSKVLMQAPLSMTSMESPPAGQGYDWPPVELAVEPEGIFATVVGPAKKKTMAGWHVTTSQALVEAMLMLVE